MIVLDASVVFDLVVGTPEARTIEASLFETRKTWHVPHVLDLEVAHALRRHVAIGSLTSDRAERALEDLQLLQLQRYPHDLLLPRIWQLRHNATAYDAAYLALAEALSATLYTRDARLASSPGHRAVIKLF